MDRPVSQTLLGTEEAAALYWKDATPHFKVHAVLIWGAFKPFVHLEITGDSLFEGFNDLTWLPEVCLVRITCGG